MMGYLSFYRTEFGRQVLKQEADYVRRHLLGCGNILDIACGPGVFERELSDMNITGVDHSTRMIGLARAQSKKRFYAAKAERLPFPDSYFDGVFTIASLAFISDYKKALDEAARVMKKGGRIVVLMLNPESYYFRGMLKERGYLRRNIKHPDLRPSEVKGHLSKRFEVSGEYLLGVRGKEIFISEDPRYAALYAIKGRLKR